MAEDRRVAGGIKAALHNDNVSESTKRDLEKRLEEYPDTTADADANKNPGNVLGGKKAALKNDNVKPETKERLQGEVAELEREIQGE
ncbi:MAG: hypothetical protein M1829_001592 [Trizodia sp. TS-e1964]|nr:MAG: hypothetical protein M1829_001592 [Trizodia sp. TS-e1964]